jgi:hypothetical protein
MMGGEQIYREPLVKQNIKFGFIFFHGGDPLLLLRDKGHESLINFIREMTVQNKHPLHQIRVSC